MSASNTAYYKLGLIGLALLRNWLKGENDVSSQLMSDAEIIIDEFNSDLQILDSQVPEFNVQEGYEAWANNYDQMPNLLLDAEQPVMEELLHTLPQGKMIDMACGTGRYTSFLKELGHDVMGIDQSASMLAVAKKKNPNILYQQSDISKTNLKSKSFDGLVCALALSHFKTLDAPMS